MGIGIRIFCICIYCKYKISGVIIMYGNFRINELKIYCNYDYKLFGNFINLVSRNEEDEELLFFWVLIVDVVGVLLLVVVVVVVVICCCVGSFFSCFFVCCICCFFSCNCCWSNWSCDCIGMGVWGCWVCFWILDSWDRSFVIGFMFLWVEVEEEEEEEERLLFLDFLKCILVVWGFGGFGIFLLIVGWNKCFMCFMGGGLFCLL